MKKIVLLMAVLVGIANAHAQTITPATNADVPITPATNNYTVNCDMVTCPDNPSNHVRIVAWDANSQGYFQVWDNMGNSSSIISLSTGQFEPDVVIGCYEISGTIYYEACLVSVIYNTITNSWDVIFDRYSITGVGTSSLTATLTSSTLISTPGAFVSGLYPHIDMFADPTQPLGTLNLPSLHEYAITWTEDVSGTPWDARFYTGDLNSLLNNTYTLGLAINTDIACYTDILTGEKHAVIAIHCNCFSIDVVDYNLTAGSAVVTNLASYPGVPRIEAMGLYDPSSGDAKWAIALYHWNTYFNNVDIVTNIPSLPTTTPAFTYNETANFTAIAAGVGRYLTGLSGNIGNSQYTAAWTITGPNRDFHSRGVDVTTGSFTTSNVYELNSTPIAFPSSFGAQGMSSSSNSGEGLLAAWWNGNDIVYKLTGNSMAFKTSSINNVKKAEYNVFPNPATTKLNVTGALDASYTVTNSLGQILISGSVYSKNGQVNISSLPAGVYLLNLVENGYLQKFKFTKQ